MLAVTAISQQRIRLLHVYCNVNVLSPKPTTRGCGITSLEFRTKAIRTLLSLIISVNR